MKVYIAVDMEGATGICSREQCSKGSPYYSEGRKLLLSDVNAAVEGALAGGAKEIIVADMHNGSFNLSHLDLHPAADVVYGVPHKGPRYPYLDESVDVMFLIAYHAKAGTHWGTLEHTMSSQSWFRVTANGVEIGEVGIDAALAGSVNVPVTLVTGDDKVCAEAQDLLGPINVAVVKTGLGRHRALCLSVEKTRDLIQDAARRALLLKDEIRPLSFGSPVEVITTYKHTELADGAHLNSADERRIDGYTVARTYQRFADWYGGVWDQRGT
jgi:D-amino peptidase